LQIAITLLLIAIDVKRVACEYFVGEEGLVLSRSCNVERIAGLLLITTAYLHD
jgi:hypothetical protein